MSTPILKKGARGAHVRTLQRELGVPDDGELGPVTWRAWRDRFTQLGGWGFAGSPARARRRWTLVMHPSRATAAETKRAGKRNQGVDGALAFGRRYLGKTESPAGSNTAGWGLGGWILQLLGLKFGVAWCGVYVWACLTKGAGVKGLTYRCAAVRYIYDDAARGVNGWRSRHGPRDGQPGDALILFGTSTHVALIEKRVPGGYQTLEGNTSAGNAGSQSNGGGCYRRTRPYSAVVACCRPRYS
jgi:hypothetical protein